MDQIKVFYQKGDDPFIYEVHGSFTIPSLEEIEKDLNECEYNEFFKEDGEYLITVHWEHEQRGEYGRIEIPGYWDFEIIEISHPWVNKAEDK